MQVLGAGEFILHKCNFKVLIWLDSREFQRKSKLQERNDFINDELEIEYDHFKDNVDMHYVPANDLLHYWQDIQANPSTLVAEFGKDYFKMTQHICHMKQNSIWGTQAEIVAVAMAFGKPVFTAVHWYMDNENSDYYWA